MKPQEKHKFIIVRHSWFGGNSHGWSEREFEGTQEEVDKEATFSKGEIYDTFNNCAIYVILLKEGQRLPKKRKLTWGERFSGIAFI